MVLLYHLYCWGNNPLFLIFKYCFIGVDLFFFLSGYGCCQSYQKHNYIIFYKRRAIKILPLYFFDTLTRILFSFVRLGTITFNSIKGAFMFHWFMPTIILYYIIFPILFKHTTKYLYLISLVVVFIILLHIDNWFVLCSISRLPIFILGILCYKDKKITINYIISIICIFLILSTILNNNNLSFFISNLLALPLLLLLQYLPKIAFINYIGKMTLPIYLSNGWTMIICSYFIYSYPIIPNNPYSYILFYIICTILLSYLYKTINGKLFNYYSTL